MTHNYDFLKYPDQHSYVIRAYSNDYIMKNQLFNFLLLAAMVFAVNTVQAQADQPTKIAKKAPTETVRTAPDHREKAVNQEQRLEKVNRKRAANGQSQLERKKPATLENAEGQKVQKQAEGKKELPRQPRVKTDKAEDAKGRKAKDGKAKKANGHRRANHPGKGKAVGRQKDKDNKKS